MKNERFSTNSSKGFIVSLNITTTYVQKRWSVNYGNQISLNVVPVFD